MTRSPESIVGCLLGTAVGDALGLPYEGLSRHRAKRLLGVPDRHRFCLGRGMVSDDTEHACMVAQSLIACGGDDVEKFSRQLASRLRWWLLGCPAGVGLATLRACLKLWIGFGPQSSGVFSAGNGPAMRAPIIGASLTDQSQVVQFVRASSRLTHTDPKAEHGAIAVALAAFMARDSSEVDPRQYLDCYVSATEEGTELHNLLESAVASVERGQSTPDFATEIGLANAVSGYTNHTVPVVIHAWLRNQSDFAAAVRSVIECGGDADTTAAIVGGIVGAAVGASGIPQDWLARLCEWPRSAAWMRRLGEQLHQSVAESATRRPMRLNPVAVLTRNACFAAVVLFHGFRRLLPPY